MPRAALFIKINPDVLVLLELGFSQRHRSGGCILFPFIFLILAHLSVLQSYFLF